MGAPLPTADEAFGPVGGKPTADQAFGPATAPAPASGSFFDNYFANSAKSETRILEAFGQGAKDSWGTEPLGLSPETNDALRKAGWFNDFKDGRTSFLKSVNEAIIRPAAATLDLAMRTGTSAFAGASAMLGQAAHEMPIPEAANPVKGAAEVVGAIPQGFLPELSAVPHGAPDLTHARSLRVVGEGEGGYFGTKEAAPQTVAARAEAIKSNAEQMASQAKAEGQPEAPQTAQAPVVQPPDIHAVARQIAPETFQEYDALAARRDQYRAQIEASQPARAETPEAQAAQARIDAILSKVGGVEDRLTNAAANRLEDARDALDAAMKTDTVEMASARKLLLEADYRMRDLAPDVAAAYRKAQDEMPAQPEEANAAPQQIAEPSPAEQVATPEAQAPESVTPKPATQPANENTVSDIAGDVQRKLVAAGRPEEEAQAAAAIIQAHYEARAERFGGAKGTAQDLYAAEAPAIKGAAKQTKRELEMAQSGRTLEQSKRASIAFKDGRATIKLFKSADASSFMHETGHAWLEELMRDASDDRAPDDLKADAQTVHDWLGTKAGEDIPTKAHEKFARGFERYLMEGVAPSQKLASVFAKFKAWLTQIYETVNRLRAPINDDIRSVFDRLLSANPEKTVIAPERGIETTMADIHEAEAQHTTPERAGAVADNMRSEIDTIAKEKVPHVHAELIAAEARGVASADEGFTSGGDASVEPATTSDASGFGEKPESGNKTEAKGFSGAEYDAAAADVKLARSKQPAPPSLFDAIRELGGIRVLDKAGKAIPEAGEVLAALKDYKNPRGVKRLINNETGLTPDYLREALTERGWLGRGDRDVGATDLHELFSALSEEAQGGKIFHPEDAATHQIEARKALDEELTRAGVASSDSPSFAATKLANWRASEDARKFADEQEMAAHEELSRLEPADYEELQSHGYEPGSDIGAEVEHRGSPIDNGSQDFATRETEDGAGFGASKPSGSAKEPERPAGPNDTFARPDSDLIDKAGNIVLDNLNTNGDVKAVLRQVADMNEGFLEARRGVVSDAEVLEFADAMGVKARDVNLKKLRALSLEDRVPLAARIRVGREMLIQSAQAVHDAMQGYDEMAYALAAQRHIMIQETLSAVTAEVGRGLRAFRDMGEEATKAQNLSEFLKENTGRTLNQLKEEMAQGKRLDTPAKVSGYLKDVRKPSLGDMGLEIFKNWLISGPITHMTYSIGNATLALWKAIPETAGEAAIGALRGTKDAERVRFGEVGAQLYAMMRGQRNGFQAAWDAMKAGQTTALPGENAAAALKGATTPFTQTRAVPGLAGQIVRAPGERMVAPIHSYFRSIGYAQSIARQAYRKASIENLTGDAFNARMADLTKEPTKEMMETARGESTEQTLMGKGGELTRRVSALMNWEPKLPVLGETKPFAFIDPFVHIASNIVEQSVIERSPLGVFSEQIRKDLRGENGEEAKNATIARMAAGTALCIVGGGLAMEGLITPSEPSDPKEAAMWRRVNGMPHSLRMGDVSIDLSRLGVLGFSLGVTADLYHAGSMIGKEDKYKIASLMVHSFTQNFLDEGFMRGPSDLIKALDDNERYGASYVRNFVSTIAVPFSVGMSQVAKQVDPYAREARTTIDAIKAKVPWWSETLLPRRDIWGEPVPNREWLGTYTQAVSTDPVDKALMDVGVYPSRPERKIRGVDLTDQQYDDFSRIAGRMAKTRLNAIVNTPGFDQMPGAIKMDLIKDAITHSRETARTIVMMQNPDIIQGALNAKLAPMQGAPN